MNTMNCYIFPDGITAYFMNQDRKNHLHHAEGTVSFDNFAIERYNYRRMKISYETWKKRMMKRKTLNTAKTIHNR